LEEDARVQMAGMIGRYFRIDPVLVLKADYFEWAVRVAAVNYATEQEQKASQSKGKGNSSVSPKISHLM